MKLKGKALMLRVNSKTIALSTNATLNTTTQTIDSRTKDDATGPAAEFDFVDWTASSENVVGKNEDVTAEMVYAELLSLQLAGTIVELSMELMSNYTSAIPSAGWSPDSSTNAQKNGFVPVSGKAFIESLSLSAPESGNATLSVNFKAAGPLSPVAT